MLEMFSIALIFLLVMGLRFIRYTALHGMLTKRKLFLAVISA